MFSKNLNELFIYTEYNNDEITYDDHTRMDEYEKEQDDNDLLDKYIEEDSQYLTKEDESRIEMYLQFKQDEQEEEEEEMLEILYYLEEDEDRIYALPEEEQENLQEKYNILYNQYNQLQQDYSNQLNLKKSTGYLELILGPMFSGKTSKLLEIYKQCLFCNIPVIVINHNTDIRYHDSLLSTHDKNMIPCIQTNKLSSIWKNKNDITTEIGKAKVILINEGQFFEDLYECVIGMINSYDLKVYIAGLDGDFERKPFGQLLDLIPMCDTITKLTSICSICKNGTLAIFSRRLSNDKTQTLVGSENYIPLCRNCYSKMDNNNDIDSWDDDVDWDNYYKEKWGIQ